MLDMNRFIEQAPKADLHVHLEGTIEPELMLELARKNDVRLAYQSVDEIKNAYEFDSLDHFLSLYYQGTRVLKEGADFYAITKAYLYRAHQQNTIHSEIFIDPQTHVPKGISLDEILEGVNEAIREAEAEYGATTSLILCFLRNHGAPEAIRILKENKHLYHHFRAIGIAASEIDHPPKEFKKLFELAAAIGFKLTAHAGEEGPAQYVSSAVYDLKVDRIDHGNSAIEDEQLMQYLIEKQIPLTMCPLSNLRLQVLDIIENHPIHEMMQRGVKVTINSDDPSYFHGYMNENLLTTQKAFNWGQAEIIRLIQNSFDAAYVSDERRIEMMVRLNAFLDNQ